MVSYPASKPTPKQTLTNCLVRSQLGLDSARFTHLLPPGLVHRTKPRPAVDQTNQPTLETRITEFAV